ncbi:hypothetical protein DFH08DRAFT_876288 [Mycena albidolilacea]|uniref:RING-type domain-containing protein n=1 Tax=Mycena albidolilacea TaxID=1033008 RepID=A0AAD7EM44_9AGAR|nr:hypothetical protein DFH08DRAFT_876288 [Mycena albidolilacea]
MSCSICYQQFTSPVSLPCGHVFCRECICRTIDSIKSCSVQHYCPACRKPYCVVAIDPSLVPPYLRPHVQSPIRPVFLYFEKESAGFPSAPASTSASQAAPTSASPPASTSASPLAEPTPSPTSASLPSPTPSPSSKTNSDLGRAAAEAEALRLSCATWRRRAEVHAAANAGLLGFARAAKESTLRMRAERDAARNQCQLLKRKLAEVMAISGPEWSDSDADSPLEEQRAAVPRTAPRGLPVFLRQQKLTPTPFPAYDESTQSRFGPPIKRRRVGADIASILVGSDEGSQ